MLLFSAATFTSQCKLRCLRANTRLSALLNCLTSSSLRAVVPPLVAAGHTLPPTSLDHARPASSIASPPVLYVTPPLVAAGHTLPLTSLDLRQVLPHLQFFTCGGPSSSRSRAYLAADIARPASSIASPPVLYVRGSLL